MYSVSITESTCVHTYIYVYTYVYVYIYTFLFSTFLARLIRIPPVPLRDPGRDKLKGDQGKRSAAERTRSWRDKQDVCELRRT